MWGLDAGTRGLSGARRRGLGAPQQKPSAVARFALTNGGGWCQRIGGDLFVWGNVEFGCGNRAACERGELEAPQQKPSAHGSVFANERQEVVSTR
jgi:hypothetical protein